MQVRDVCLSLRCISVFVLHAIELDVRALVSVVHALHMGCAMPAYWPGVVQRIQKL